MARYRLRLSMSCYSQDPLRIAARSVPRPQERARRQVEGIEPLVQLASRRGGGHLDLVARGDLLAISLLEATTCWSSRTRSSKLPGGASAWARIAWTRSKSATRSVFVVTVAPKPLGAAGEGDSLGAIRFQRNVRRTVGQDLRYGAIATSGVDGGRAHHVPHDGLYGFALRD
jgi:hypothetical protein